MKTKRLFVVTLFLFFAAVQIYRLFDDEISKQLNETLLVVAVGVVLLSALASLGLFLVKKHTISLYLKHGLSERHPSNAYWIEDKTIRSEILNVETVRQIDDIKSAILIDTPYKEKFNLDKSMTITFKNDETWKLLGSDQGFEDIVEWLGKEPVPFDKRLIS